MELQIYNTKLSNQRTYMAYIRTGFAISVLAKMYKKIYILYFGILIIISSTIQYKIVNNNIDNGKNDMKKLIDDIPIMYGIIAIITLWLQFY